MFYIHYNEFVNNDKKRMIHSLDFSLNEKINFINITLLHLQS
jgi:hypothetical protein